MPDLAATLLRDIAARLERDEMDSFRLAGMELMLLGIGHRLATLERKIDTMGQTVGTVDAGLTQVQEDVAGMGTVVAGARAAFDALAAKLAAAQSSAQSQGATPQQLAGFAAIHSDLVAQREGLAQAVAMNTAAASEPDAQAGAQAAGTAQAGSAATIEKVTATDQPQPGPGDQPQVQTTG